ncbi:fluoroquinolone export ABC transporter permease subunit [Intestinibacter sp.]|uniref:fluoroquinolone export ABC transporter permease subunit n=1 Tax=Intestinibacter sp. TaxID=1965304 RepID=UPI003F1776F1
MRLGRLISWDIKLQTKYGFYLLYGILTVLYIVILFILPETIREKVASLLIFSDPAAMGLFFMGAIILLEKSQRIPCAFAVSPIDETEYIISKVASLCVIALIVATILETCVETSNLAYMLLGTMLSSIIFTLLGIIIATKITSLNQFILCTVPIEIIGFVPAVLHLFDISYYDVFYVYPPNVCIDMIAGNAFSPIGLLFTVVLIYVLFIIARKCVSRMLKSIGGVSL